MPLKKKKTIATIIILLVTLWVWKDYKKIDIYFINQNKITYDSKNLNSSILKKIDKIYNNVIENFLVTYNDNHKNYWLPEKDMIRDQLPNFKNLKTKNITTTSIYNNLKNFSDWPRSHGNSFSNRFSNLKKINNFNANELEVAWMFEIKDEIGDIQANPIIINGIIYTPIAGGFIIAINGKTGKLLWKSERFSPSVAKRGLVFWEGTKKDDPRIIFSNRERLISLNVKNGKPIENFGKKGKVRTGLNVTTPLIYKNNIVIVTWDRAVEVYDLLTGKIKWKLKYKINNNKRIGGTKFNNSGANSWGGISADINRGILYFTTGNPHFYFDGTRRPGRNKNSNSVIAVDLENKKELWSFQETAHDIWNLDLPAPPILTSIKKDNREIDVVVTPTKRSNTLILDRMSGDPIFDFKYKKAPASKLRGEKTSLYQADIKIPEPFGENVFEFNQLWSYDPKKLEDLRKKYKNYNYGFYEPYELNKKTLQYNFNGGAEWMGASIDHDKNIMYVTSNNILWETWIDEIENKDSLVPKYSSNFKRALDDNGFPVVEPPWGTISALNLNTGKIIWQVPLGEYESLKEKGIPKTGTENFGGVTATSGNIAIATGTLDKKMYVYDSTDGKILYSKKLPYIGSAPPSTYLFENEQYIVLHASGGFSLKKGYPDLVETGNVIIAFKLKNKLN